jgi:hypothetical protein
MLSFEIPFDDARCLCAQLPKTTSSTTKDNHNVLGFEKTTQKYCHNP